MKIFADYHTHTTYSHGKNSVFENATAAKRMGLKEIAITDHGFNHFTYGIKRKYVESIKRDVTKAEDDALRVYFGIEANFTGIDASIDLRKDEIEMFDLIIVGYHKAVTAESFKSTRKFIWRNNISKIFRPSKALVKMNTEIVTKVLRKYPVDIFSHPCLTMKVDMKEVAEVAAEVGTYIELNGKRESMTDEEVEKVLETNAVFIINSDAHSKERIGEVSIPMAQAERVGIPVERIANVGRLPVFKRIKR